MARKVKFPLRMSNGIEVRELEELKDNFDISSIYMHYKTGKLIIWLNDHDCIEAAKRIEAINKEDHIFQQLYAAFDIIPDESTAEPDKHRLDRMIEIRNELVLLGVERKVIDNLDEVALTQEDLEACVREGKKHVYLVKGEFDVKGLPKEMQYSLVLDAGILGKADSHQIASASTQMESSTVLSTHYIDPAELFSLGKQQYRMQKYNQAVLYFQQAAEYENRDAFYYVGKCYAKGRGVERDYAIALDYFKQASDKGHIRAKTFIGYCYYRGLGVEKEYDNAARYFKEAAVMQDPEAQCYLGELYWRGKGVKQSSEKAVYWLTKAANQGFAMAQNFLGVLYFNGDGVKQSVENAVIWFKKAAEQGYAEAQYHLGKRYYKGEGVAKDWDEAKHWLTLASEQGNEKAEKLLREL